MELHASVYTMVTFVGRHDKLMSICYLGVQAAFDMQVLAAL